MHVRPATVHDLGALLDLYAQLNADDPALERDRAIGVLEEIEMSPGNEILVLDDGDTVIGTTYLNVIPNLSRGARPYAVIENVVITASRRGEKLGKLLMAATLERARAHGCYKAMLQTGSTTPATHAFYRACGFDPDAKTAYLVRW